MRPVRKPRATAAPTKQPAQSTTTPGTPARSRSAPPLVGIVGHFAWTLAQYRARKGVLTLVERSKELAWTWWLGGLALPVLVPKSDSYPHACPFHDTPGETPAGCRWATSNEHARCTYPCPLAADGKTPAPGGCHYLASFPDFPGTTWRYAEYEQREDHHGVGNLEWRRDTLALVKTSTGTRWPEILAVCELAKEEAWVSIYPDAALKLARDLREARQVVKRYPAAIRTAMTWGGVPPDRVQAVLQLAHEHWAILLPDSARYVKSTPGRYGAGRPWVATARRQLTSLGMNAGDVGDLLKACGIVPLRKGDM